MRTNSRLRLTRDMLALFVVVTFSWLSFGISPTYAEDLTWRLPFSGITNTGDWFTAGNWTELTDTATAPPNPTESASVNVAPPSAPAATIASPGAAANELLIGGATLGGTPP